MVDYIVSKPLGLVLIITAHMAFNGTSRAQITVFPGDNVTLNFTFNFNVTQVFSVYHEKEKKIGGSTKVQSTVSVGNFHLYPQDNSVFCEITNIKSNQSGLYWATLFPDTLPLRSSDKVLLTVLEFRPNTAPTDTSDLPLNATTAEPSSRPTLISSHTVTVLVVSPVVLLAALLPFIIWCLLRTKDSQTQPPPSSNPTVQETIEATNNTLVYSVLDFPKRPSAVMEIDPNDTEYAAVHYLSEQRYV